jgi:hypothetical protein
MGSCREPQTSCRLVASAVCLQHLRELSNTRDTVPHCRLATRVKESVPGTKKGGWAGVVQLLC